jgi:hypothetical protein
MPQWQDYSSSNIEDRRQSLADTLFSKRSKKSPADFSRLLSLVPTESSDLSREAGLQDVGKAPLRYPSKAFYDKSAPADTQPLTYLADLSPAGQELFGDEIPDETPEQRRKRLGISPAGESLFGNIFDGLGR